MTLRSAVSKALFLPLALAALCAPVQAADYPEKPVTLVVAYGPGGQGDIFARMVAERVGRVYKAGVVVDNKPGVSGTLGTRFVAKAKNDGYTLLLGQTGEITVNRALIKDLGYDPMKELTPVALIGNAPLVMLAPADAPYNTVAEFLQFARSKKDGKAVEVSYGSVGAGTPGHLSAVALALGAKLDMTHIPYKSVGPLMTDLIAGRLQLFFSSASAAVAQIKGGKLKALAVSTPQRMASLPQVPAVAESVAAGGAGLTGFSYSLWGGIFAPQGTPAAIIEGWNKEVNAVLASDEVRSKMEGDGVVVIKNSSAEFAELVRAESVKFERLVRDANIKLEQ